MKVTLQVAGKYLAAISAAMVMYGCGSGGSGSGAGLGGGGTGTENYLNAVGFSGNALRLDQRFVAYSKKANLVSVIDPVQKMLVWSAPAKGFDFGQALPTLDGAALFDESGITIKSADEEKTFILDSDYLHVATAKNTAAYSLSSTDGRTLEIVRSLGSAQWQQETFTVPWPAPDASLSTPPENQPVLLASFYNDAGTVLAVFSPSDGRYAIYTAISATEAITDVTSWCAGDGAGTPQNATYSSIAWDEGNQVFYAGDKDGRIFAIDPAGPCVTAATAANLTLPGNGAAVYLSVYSAGRIGAAQGNANGNDTVYTVTYDGNAFALEPQAYANICEVAISSITLSNDKLLIMCATNVSQQQDEANPPAQKSLYVDPRLYITADMLTGEVISEKSIDKDASAGVAIDSASDTLYRMREGAFGTLETTDLLTGQSTETTGLYIEGLLD